MNWSYGAVFASCLAAACTTVSGNGLYSEFRSLGFSQSESDCLVRELDARLDSGSLSRVYQTVRFERNGGERDSYFRLMRSEDGHISAAVAAAGRVCLPGSHQ